MSRAKVTEIQNPAKVELGDKVKCRVTQFTGVVTQRTENLNGCVQFTLRPPVRKDGTWPESFSIDVENLDVLEKNVAKVKQRVGGGPMTKPAKAI